MPSAPPCTTAVAFSILVVPGVILYTYVAISPALVKLRRLPIRAALAKSVALVRGSFWRVLVFTAVVVLVTDVLTAVAAASRVFAVFYVMQCLIALIMAGRRGQWTHVVGVLAVGLAMVAIAIFGLSS